MSTDSPPAPRPSPRGHRFGVLYGIVALAVVGLGVVQAQADLERNFKGWLSSTVVLLALLLSLLWFLLLSRVRWVWRVSVLGGLLLLGFALTQSLRVEGTADGTGRPRLVWKWASHPRAAVPSAPVGSIIAPVPATTAGGADTPQFFGPLRDGIVRGVALGTNWTSTPPRELWRQPVGHGWSAFSVVAGRAYTQEQQGGEEWVSCLDLATGRRVWTATNSARFDQWQGGEGPRGTPTVHEGLLYALGATGTLDCLDATTGRRLWRKEVLREHHLPNLIWGVSASPLVVDGLVVVTGGFTNRDTVVAYDRKTGESRWTSGHDKASYASPILALLLGERLILSVNAGSFTAHDPATGRIVLDYEWPTDKWPKASQPVVVGTNRVFLSAGYGVGCVLLEISRTAAGALSAQELWKNKSMKTQFNSAVERQGFLYGLDDGLLACVDLQTGQRRWKDGRYGSGQSLLVEDLVLIQSEPGPVVLARAAPGEFQELGRIQALHGKTWNHPTVAGRYLLVRNDEEAACYELPSSR